MRFKAIITILFGIGIAVSVPIVQQVATRLISHVPTAYAASKQDPLNAGSDLGSRRDDGSLGVTATDPNGNNLGSGAPIYRGETINVKLSYTVVNTSGSAWDAYLNFDINNSACSTPGAWTGCFGATTGGAVRTDVHDAAPAADSGAIEQNDNCPSFYNNYDSPYADIAENGEGFRQGSEYPWSNPYPGALGHSTCLTQGESVVWHGAHMNTVGQKNYTVNYTVNPKLSGDNVPICISGDITLGDVGAGGNNGGDLYYRTKAHSLCLTANVPTTISGNVQSDPYAATGKKFANQTSIVSVSANCQYNDMNSGDGGGYVSTDGSGGYSFGWFQNEPYCLGPNSGGGGPSPPAPCAGTSYNWSYDGTCYTNVQSPSTYSGGSSSGPNDPPNGSNPNTWSSWTGAQSCGPGDPNPTHCGGYNMYWLPQPASMPTTKASSPVNGTAVVPGQPMAFSMAATNPYDSNTPSSYLADEIPLNIDPNGSTIAPSISATLTNAAPGGPINWSTNVLIPCTSLGVPTAFSYGYSGSYGSPSRAVAVCGYTAPNGTTPGYVHVALSTMPAYSRLTLNWGGNVIAAPLVGVYPTNGAYCNNGGVNFGDPNSVLAGCSDYTAGLQGVSNFAYSGVCVPPPPPPFGPGGLAPAPCGMPPPTTISNFTYNPIPGSLACVGKDSPNAKTEQGAPLSVGTGSCGTNTPAPGDLWVYSANDPTYKSADFRILVGFNPSQGPVHYSVIDQNDGAANTTTGAPLDPAFQNTSSLSGNGQQAGARGSQFLHWDGQNSAIVSNPNYTYHVDFTNVNDGHVATNSVKACWPQYWTSGYPVSCVTTPTPISVTQQKVTNPFVTTSNGDVHAGGGPGKCSTPASVQAAQNPGAAGQWFVTASGNLTGASDKAPFFTSNGGTASLAYGTVCRPDIVTSTQNYANKPGDTVAYNSSIWTNPAAQAAADGKVVVANSNVNIPAGVFISARFTLLVNNANVNVGGNITNAAIALTGAPEANHPAFGVVINNGNLNIDKGVTQLDGFYFVAPDSAGSNGLVNTCAGLNGSPTLSPSGPYTVIQCQTPLTVQGLMMANAFRLNRTTDPGASDTKPAEYVQFDDRLYSATPPGFSDLSQTYLPPIYQPNANPRY